MRWEDLITVTPGVRSGKPCVAGTRITVQDVLEYLASGMSEAEILADFPSLTLESIRAVLAFAAAAQSVTSTNPRNETTTYGYDALGFLTSVTGPSQGRPPPTRTTQPAA